MKILLIIGASLLAVTRGHDHLPGLPCELKAKGFDFNGRETVSIWQHSQHDENDCVKSKTPRLYLLIANYAWSSLLRMDVGNPIFKMDDLSTKVREYFINSLVFDVHSTSIFKDTYSGTEMVKNQNGQMGTFANANGIATFNNKKLSEQMMLSDGSAVYVIEAFPFDLKELIRLQGNFIFNGGEDTTPIEDKLKMMINYNSNSANLLNPIGFIGVFCIAIVLQYF